MAYVDCDSHFLPNDAFDNVAPEFWHQRPQLIADTVGNSYWIFEPRQRNMPEYSRHIPHMFSPKSWGPRISDPAVRVADMAKAQFGTQALVWRGAVFYPDTEPGLAASLCRSYNKSIGRILKAYPGKFIGLAAVPLQDGNLATEEIERAVGESGLHAAVICQSVGEKDLDAEELWPFYAKAEKLDVPIIVHPDNTGPMPGGWSLTRHFATRGYGLWSALGHSMSVSLAVANLMFGGVLDAFPKLRFCFLEAGGTQVPHLIDGLTIVHQAEGDYDRLQSRPKRKPIEYLDRLYFSVRATETLLGVLVERYGKQSWVVGSDYPHADAAGSWPDTVPTIQARRDLSDDAKEAILGENALRLFRIKSMKA